MKKLVLSLTVATLALASSVYAGDKACKDKAKACDGKAKVACTEKKDACCAGKSACTKTPGKNVLMSPKAATAANKS